MGKANRLGPLALTVAALLVVSSLAWTRSSAAADFSADLISQGKGRKLITGKIFVQGSKIRQEIVEDGENQVMIFRPDKGVIWMVTPEEQVYMEMPYQTDNKRFESWSAEREKSAKYLGEETVSGLLCKKYEIAEEGEKATYWVSARLPLPVKVEYKDGRMEYKNIKEGAVSESLFEVPSEYQKVVIPMMPESLDGSVPPGDAPVN